ncbi:uncharacterized protein C16orf78 homolog [Sciurus carolinensis]|uniref:uncharacterized protein C16orf78 homolog n=1 Tax=Sciurus carolinensis TaxID=30640 RepID=UPI001FB51FE4|nr:uncharacterized protein C16orf78 homolog [Sciurus carolinensis]
MAGLPPMSSQDSSMPENQENPKRAMPTERKSLWRTAEERRMSDLTRVLEWLERRRGKKKQDAQKLKTKIELPPKANEKERKKGKVTVKQEDIKQSPSKTEETLYRRIYGPESMGRRVSIVSSSYAKEGPRKSELDIKDAIALESTQRASTYRRQSSIIDPTLQEAIFSGRRATLTLRDWAGKTQDIAYERKLKTLMDKSTEPKIETMKMLKPEEVLNCRYLRLSKNNIRTLLKLCKDAGLNMDIHPHMVEAEIDSKKVFTRGSNATP